MKNRFAISLCLGGSLVASISHALDLKQAKFTQVVNDVWVVSNEDDTEKFARVNDFFNMPDLVRTGLASRAELVAADDTITRVGASTIFAFDPASRTIDLQKGSLLFHSPKGMGGGTIRTGSATASVLGTTLIVTTTANGGFKVIDLEGHVAIKFANGVEEYLQPGQMTFILSGGKPSPVITIRLDELVKNSLLVQGFNQPLPSFPLILAAIAKQIQLIKSGGALDTGLLVGDNASPTTVQVIDANSIIPNEGSDEPPTTPSTPTLPADFTLDSSTLDPRYITSLGAGGGNAFIVAGSLAINSPTIDLSPYASPTPYFVFAAGSLAINGSLDFTGLPANASSELFLFADNQLSIASGSTVEADVGVFLLSAGGQNGITWTGVNLKDTDASGDIVVGGYGGFGLAPTLSNSPFAAAAESGTPTLSSITINGGSISAPAGVELVAGSDISVTGCNITTSYLLMYSGDGILLDGTGSSLSGGGSGSAVYLEAAGSNGGILTVNQCDFTPFATVSMSANTVNLTNVYLGTGTVELASLSGHWTYNTTAVAGDVNFISGDTYGTYRQPIQDFVNQGGNVTVKNLQGVTTQGGLIF
jgi:hypothetical protein